MASDSEAPTLDQIASTYARALTDDLRSLVGVDVALGGAEVERVEGDAVALDDQPIAVTTAQAKGGATAPLFLVFPRPEAATLASLLLGQSEERRLEARGLALEAEVLDAFGEVANLCIAVLSRVLSDEFSLPAVGVASIDQIDHPESDSSWIAGGSYVAFRYDICIPGFDDERVSLVLPERVVATWFGDDDESETEGPVERSTPVVGDVESVSIVFIDSSDDDRKEVEDLEEEMGHSVWTLDPDEFDPDDLEEFAEAGAFFIEWELGVRTGLDVLELLRADERMAALPIIMVTTKPSEAMVRCALRCGANSVVMKPYAADEIAARLNPLLAQEKLGD